MKYNCVILLGPTAVGKTKLGVKIAHNYSWDIISADSRQVYRGLDIGSGKDLSEYFVEDVDITGNHFNYAVSYHLIDIVDLDTEYNVFKYQTDFYRVFNELNSNNKMAFVVGGTGMYVDAIIRGYDFVPVEENYALRQELAELSLEELDKII